VITRHARVPEKISKTSEKTYIKPTETSWGMQHQK
jgi:hypothetical protein